MRGFSTSQFLENAVLLGFFVSTTLFPGKFFSESLVDTIMLVFSWKKIALGAGGYANA